MQSDETIDDNDVKIPNMHTSVNIPDRLIEADKIVKKSVLVSVGIGFIPFPVVDVFALTSIQLYTIKKLSIHYNIEFSKDRGKTIIASLISSIVPISLSETVFSAIKVVPIIGYPTSLLALPALAGASTYALGRVFIRHFEAGGTLFDLDPEKVKDYFREQFKKGHEIVKGLKRNKGERSKL